jgi:hypothetical protein
MIISKKTPSRESRKNRVSDIGGNHSYARKDLIGKDSDSSQKYSQYDENKEDAEDGLDSHRFKDFLMQET